MDLGLKSTFRLDHTDKKMWREHRPLHSFEILEIFLKKQVCKIVKKQIKNHELAGKIKQIIGDENYSIVFIKHEKIGYRAKGL